MWTVPIGLNTLFTGILVSIGALILCEESATLFVVFGVLRFLKFRFLAVFCREENFLKVLPIESLSNFMLVAMLASFSSLLACSFFLFSLRIRSCFSL